MASRKPPPRSEQKAATDSLRDFVVEKATEKLGQKLTSRAAKTAVQQQKLSDKAAKAARHLDRLSSRLETLDIWTRTEPAGRRPRFTRAEIAAAAIYIADTEGFASLSMRRLATELDAATMTLYHYVRTKDELLALVADAIMGELVVPPDEPLPSDWRAAVTIIANRTRSVLERHPWLLDITEDPAIGPNAVRHFDQSLQAVASAHDDLEARLDIVTTVDEYVFGYCINRRNNVQPESILDGSMVEYVLGLLETGHYPALATLAADLGLKQGWEQIESHLRDRHRFGRNLSRLLNGIAADL
jgi:AcrR family transcriptional regulator